MQSKQTWGNPTTFFTPCSRTNRGRCLFLPGRPFLSYGVDRRFGMLQIPVKGHEKGRIPKDAPCANHANGKNLFLAAEIRRENQELVTDILAPSLGNEGVLKVVVVIQFQSLGALGGRENQNLAAEAFRVKADGVASHDGAAVFTGEHGSNHQGIFTHGAANAYLLVIVTLAHDVGEAHFTGGQGLAVIDFTVGSNGGTAGRSLHLGVEVAFGNGLIAQKLAEVVIGGIPLERARRAIMAITTKSSIRVNPLRNWRVAKDTFIVGYDGMFTV